MADINISGVNLTSGQEKSVSDADILTSNDNVALRGAFIGSTRGIPGIGPQGSYGFTGIQGVTGTTGATGIGAQGITGTIGLRGLTGLGATGLQGRTGLIGATGSVIGNTGIQGNTGGLGFAAYSFLADATTITYSAELIGLASTGAAFTVTLPSATGMMLKTFTFQDEAGYASTNNIVIHSAFSGGGPDDLYGTINGYSGIRIDSPFMAVEITSNGNRYLARLSKTGATGIQGETGVQGTTGLA